VKTANRVTRCEPLHRVVGFSANRFECYKSVSRAALSRVLSVLARGHLCWESYCSGGRGCSDNAVGSGKNLLFIDKYREKPILWDNTTSMSDMWNTHEHSRTERSKRAFDVPHQLWCNVTCSPRMLQVSRKIKPNMTDAHDWCNPKLMWREPISHQYNHAATAQNQSSIAVYIPIIFSFPLVIILRHCWLPECCVIQNNDQLHINETIWVIHSSV
jgi:hypothetical protein